jgi:DNA-binding MarR family transcriptional regulator
MDEKEKKFKRILEHYQRAMHQFNELEDTPTDFGSGDILYRSEIHTIEAIGNNQGTNLTELAATLEITKGTLSPLVTKLVKKGLVLKSRGDRNDKEITLKLTEKGEKAFDGHRAFHRAMYLNFMDLCQNISLRQLEAFEEILLKIMDNIDGEIHKTLPRKNNS